MAELRTERLLLRNWKTEDREALAQLNSDPRVMEFFPSTLTREKSDALVDRIEASLLKHGFGFWAVEIPGITECAGFIGLSSPNFEAHFMPCVEVGWRLAAEHWGQGYAPEGARAALEHGFNKLELDEIVSFTTPDNLPSRRVMEKIGMTHDTDGTFHHPAFDADDPMGDLVLYRKLAAR